MIKKTLLFLCAAAAVIVAAFFLRNREPERAVVEPDPRPLADTIAESDDSSDVPQLVVSVGLTENASESGAFDESRRLQILDEVFQSKNDNDPRLDTEFRDLSVSMKLRLRKRYSEIPLEQRNRRGTIVFLIGRELKTAEDVGFLVEVLSAPVCLSLADCSKATRGKRDQHAEMGQELTLAYPQMVALKSLENLLASGQMPEHLRHALGVASRSAFPMVAKKAREMALRQRQGD